MTEWTGTHLPSLQATWTGANALAVPNVTVTRGAGANAGATGGRLTADTGGALVVETDTEDAIGRLPDPENDYLRYDSGLVLKARVMRFHDSRWATESDTFNVTVGDGDDAVSFDGIAAYTCDPRGTIKEYDDGGGSLTSNPLHLTRITIVMDEALSDGRFVADSTLPKCALEYSHISQVWERSYGPNQPYATYSEALAHTEADCDTFRTPNRDADLRSSFVPPGIRTSVPQPSPRVTTQTEEPRGASTAARAILGDPRMSSARKRSGSPITGEFLAPSCSFSSRRHRGI